MPTETTKVPFSQDELDVSTSGKFQNPDFTESGAPRAKVVLKALKTLWFNTGTLCNITCRNCYIESSPKNDRLAYLCEAEVRKFLEEIATDSLPVEEIGFTGGEPFMNPDIIPILAACLDRGYRVLLLTNGMKPMLRHGAALRGLNACHGGRLVIRLSVDHYTPELHMAERGAGSWEPVIEGMRWLSENELTFHVAGRTCWGEPEESLRQGYAGLFAENGVALDAHDPVSLVLFPEMNEAEDIPEITEACWDKLGVLPDDLMCASSRMVVKHKGAAAPHVMACTLIAYEQEFNMGPSLSRARTEISLNHPHCARFCVLGGGSCSK